MNPLFLARKTPAKAASSRACQDSPGVTGGERETGGLIDLTCRLGGWPKFFRRGNLSHS